MSIREWPEGERPREKLLARGCGALSDAELIAVLLGSGLPGKDAIALGRELLGTSGGLGALLADPVGRVRLRGIGPAKRARLIAALELARRALGEQLRETPTLGNPRDSGDYLRAQLRHLPYEVFACLFLDNRHRVLAFQELFRGTIDSASVHPREVVRACLHHNASAVILAHNHPKGYIKAMDINRLHALAWTQSKHSFRRRYGLAGNHFLDSLSVHCGKRCGRTYPYPRPR